MLAQNDPASLIFGQLEDRTSGMKATSGGSSDTEEKVPTTMPSVAAVGMGRGDQGDAGRVLPQDVAEPGRVVRPVLGQIDCRRLMSHSWDCS